MKLLDHTLHKILQNEEKMEEYLQQFGDKPSSIDPVIWQVHLSAPAKKRMPVLNKYFQQMLKKYSLVFSFLPDHLVLAKVYRELNIPFDVNSSRTTTVDLISHKKLPKIARFNRYAKIYNSWRKTEENSDLGIYEYHEERSGPFVSYAEFRKEYKNRKSHDVSAASVLSQLAKNKTREKLVSNFASTNTQFSVENSNRPNDPEIGARAADQCARKQAKTVSQKPVCNLPKKQTMPKENSFKIFKSKYRPRLDVQVKTKHSGSPSVAYPIAGNECISSGNYLKAPDHSPFTSSKSRNEAVSTNRRTAVDRSTSSNCLLKIADSPKPRISPDSSTIGDETVLANRMDVENCRKSKEIRTEAVPSQLYSQKSVSVIQSTPVCENSNLSEKSVSVIQPTPVRKNLNSSEPEVIYSSNRCEDDVAFMDSSTCHPTSPNVICHQVVSDREVRNAAEFFGQPNEANSTLLSVYDKSNQSHSSCEFEETSDRVLSVDFDQLYKRIPLRIEHKKGMSSLKEAKRLEISSAFDRLRKKYGDRHLDSRMWQTDSEEDENKISDSETSAVSSKVSPSPAYSIIFARRSSESELEEMDAVNFSSVASPTVARSDEPTDYTPRQPVSDLVRISPDKASSRSKNATPEQLVTNSVSAEKEQSRLQSENSSLDHSVSEIISSSLEKLRSQSRNSTLEQPISKMISASKEMFHLQSKRSTPEQPVLKTVHVSPGSPRPLSNIPTPEHPVSKVVTATKGNSGSSSKDSTPEQPLQKIVTVNPEKPLSQSKKPARKKTIPLKSSKAAKATKARTDEKQIKKLTDFVSFSVRKRHASNSEFSESDHRSVAKSPVAHESVPRSTSIWSPKSYSAGSRKSRKVKKLFNESEDHLSLSPFKEKSSAEVDSPDSRICKSPSLPKNTDLLEMEKSSDFDLLMKSHSRPCYQLREGERSLIESEDSLLLLATKEELCKIDFDRTTCESLSSSEHIGRPEMEKSSDSDSGSIILSKNFKTLSLGSKKSSILFPSQSSKISPSSSIQNSHVSAVSNSQFLTEITLDHVDRMMEGIMSNEFTDSSFRFELPSQFTFKESPNSENYGDKFNVSNFSGISVLSSNASKKTSVAHDIPDKYSILSSQESAVSRRHSSKFDSQNTTYPASRSTVDENFFSSQNSLRVATNEGSEDEFSDGKISNSSFSIRKPSITRKKSTTLLSSNFKDGPPTRRHCLSLPVERKSSRQKKELIKRQVNAVADTDDTSDEDIFRETSVRSLPIQLRKKSTSFSAQQFGRKCSQDKENRVGEKKSRRNFEKIVEEFQKLPLSVSAKSCQSLNREKKKSQISFLKSSQFVATDDEYESDELNAVLNDSLTELLWKEREDVAESDAESTTSHCFDKDISQLLTEYAALNAEQQSLSLSSRASNSESTTFMSTLSVKSNSSYSNPKGRAPSRKPITSADGSNYKDIMWNSYPDSLETALTTPEEKLEEVRNNLREKVINSNSQKLFSSQNSKSSKENERDSFGFLDWV